MAYNSFLLRMIKLVFATKNKIIKHGARSFHQLREAIRTNFPEAPVDYSLSYLDEDKDEICLNSDEDLVNMLNNCTVKLHKVYIKQSLSQTVVLELERSDYIEPSFEEVPEGKVEEPEEERKEGFLKEKKEEAQEVSKEEVLEVQKEEQKKEEAPLIKEVPEVPHVPEVAQNKEVQQQKEDKPQNWSSYLKVQNSQDQKIAQLQPESSDFSWADKFKPSSRKIQPGSIFDSSPPSPPKNQPNRQSIPQPDYPQADPKISNDAAIQSEQIFDEPIKEQHRVDVTRARIFSKVEESRGPSKKQAELMVHGVICTHCRDEFGIMGVRYQCIFCDRFNLCSNCEAVVEHEHALVKVKRPGQAIKTNDIVTKFKELLEPSEVADSLLPAGHYVPSVNKEDAKRVVEAAREAFSQGTERAIKLMEDVFFKMQMSHKNPYGNMRPAMGPVRVETVYEKAKYLEQMVMISYNEAMKFVNKHANKTSAQITEAYFRMKNS